MDTKRLCVCCGIALTKNNWAPYDGVHNDELCCRCYCRTFRGFIEDSPHENIYNACYEKWMNCSNEEIGYCFN